MKNTKDARIRQKISMLKHQFLQSDTGLFDQALGEHEIEAVMRELVEPHRERIYPPLDKAEHRGQASEHRGQALHFTSAHSLFFNK